MIGAWAVAWSLVVWKLASWSNAASLADAAPAERVQARLAFVLLLAATYGGYLWLLARLRSPAVPP